MDLNKYCYDNGCYLIGLKKNIERLTLNEMSSNGNEEYYIQTLEELKDYNDNDFLVIDYDNGMGNYYQSFSSEDKIEIE